MMSEKSWSNTCVIYGLTEDEKTLIHSQMKKFNVVIASGIKDVLAYPSFLIILNPNELTNEDVRALSINCFDEDTKVYLTCKDKRLKKLLNLSEFIIDSEEKVKKLLKSEKERINFLENKSHFFLKTLVEGRINLLAARPQMGRKRIAIEIAQRYMEIYPYKAYIFCVQPLRDEYINKIHWTQSVEFIYERSFKEICDFIKEHNTENIFCVIADIDLLQDVDMEELSWAIGGTNSKVLLTTKCAKELEAREDLHPRVSDILDFDDIRNYIDNVIVAYRQGYYNPKLSNKLEFSIHDMREITSEKIELNWDFEKCFC